LKPEAGDEMWRSCHPYPIEETTVAVIMEEQRDNAKMAMAKVPEMFRADFRRFSVVNADIGYPWQDRLIDNDRWQTAVSDGLQSNIVLWNGIGDEPVYGCSSDHASRLRAAAKEEQAETSFSTRFGDPSDKSGIGWILESEMDGLPVNHANHICESGGKHPRCWIGTGIIEFPSDSEDFVSELIGELIWPVKSVGNGG
jgi:hypothetical protein